MSPVRNDMNYNVDKYRNLMTRRTDMVNTSIWLVERKHSTRCYSIRPYNPPIQFSTRVNIWRGNNTWILRSGSSLKNSWRIILVLRKQNHFLFALAVPFPKKNKYKVNDLRRHKGEKNCHGYFYMIFSLTWFMRDSRISAIFARRAVISVERKKCPETLLISLHPSSPLFLTCNAHPKIYVRAARFWYSWTNPRQTEEHPKNIYRGVVRDFGPPIDNEHRQWWPSC